MARRRILQAAGLVAVAAGVAALVAVAARGDPDEPTRAEYLAQVNAICTDYGARLDRIAPPTDLSSPGAVVESLQAALPVLEEQEQRVRALRSPAALQADLEQFFRLTDRSLVELHAALDAALERALFPMATALTRFGERRDEAKLVARRLGFRC